MSVGRKTYTLSPVPGELTFDVATLNERVAAIQMRMPTVTPQALLSLVDHTTLQATDTPKTINRHIDEALAGPGRPAAVCVTPDYAGLALRRLANTPVQVASVAGAFPHGRALTNVIRHEIIALLDTGVTELDLVLDRGAFLSGATDAIYQQIAWVRRMCDNYTMRDNRPRLIKLILETGELGSPGQICDAAWLVLHAGANLVKTSTGTIPSGADAATVLLLCDVLQAFNTRYGTACGVKVSGGVRSTAEARLCYALAHHSFGEAANTPTTLRFGASKLLTQLRSEISA